MKDTSYPEVPIIEDVEVDTKKYIKEHYLGWAVFLVFVGILLEVWVIYEVFFTMRVEAGFLVFPLFVPLAGYAYVSIKISKAFIMQFAQRNGFLYQRKIDDIDSVKSDYLQKLGRRQSLLNIVSGVYNSNPLRLFSFRTYAGFRKHASYYSVFEMEFTGDVLSIIVDSRIHPFDIVITGSRFPGKKKLSLEGDFNKYFDVYIAEEYEIEALSILTPDIMQKLMEKAQLHSFEFNNNKLYIISDKDISKKSELEEMFEFSKWLIEKLAPVLARIKHDHIKAGR